MRTMGRWLLNVARRWADRRMRWGLTVESVELEIAAPAVFCGPEYSDYRPKVAGKD